jgi:hypothetical protein
MGRAGSPRSLAVVALLLAAGCGYDFGSYTLGAGGAGGTSCTTRADTLCASMAATFCEDFEGVCSIGALGTKWGGGVNDANSLAILTDESAPSPPHGLRATAGDSGSAWIAPKSFSIDPLPSTISLSYSIRVDDDSIQGNVDGAALTGIVMGTSITQDPEVALFLASDGLHAGYNSPGDLFGLHQTGALAKPTMGEWTGSYGFVIDTSDWSVSVTLGGNTMDTLGTLPSMFRSATEITLYAGLPYNTTSSGTVTVAIDDLVLEMN